MQGVRERVLDDEQTRLALEAQWSLPRANEAGEEKEEKEKGKEGGNEEEKRDKARNEKERNKAVKARVADHWIYAPVVGQVAPLQ